MENTETIANVESWTMRAAPPGNLEFGMGDENGIRFNLTVERNLVNRFKYWLFFLFFPFKSIRWTK